MGDVGVALTSLAIAVHTFCLLVFRWRSPPITALLVIGFIWLFIALIIGITFATHKGQMYYGDTQYWCWITAHYSSERIVLEYLWLYISAFASLIIYAFLALVVKGFVIVNGRSIRITTGEERVNEQFISTNHNGVGKDSKSIAMGLLFYPAVYIITVLPIAVVRWTTFSGQNSNIPFAATAFSDLLFASSGWLNVTLYSFTRPKLLPSRETMIQTPVSPFRAGPSRTKGNFPGSSTNEDDNWVELPIRPSFSPREKSSSLGITV